MAIEANSILISLSEFTVRTQQHYREWHMRKLVESISAALAKRGLSGRVVALGLSKAAVLDIERQRLGEYLAALATVPGISSYSPSLYFEFGFSRLIELAAAAIEAKKPQSFALRVRGELPYDSPEVSASLGGYLSKVTGIRVDLVKPELEMHVEVRGGLGFMYVEKLEGLGGLPYGTQGCSVALVSGGVDSAVAALLAMKRGVEPILLHVSMEAYWPKDAVARASEALRLISERVPANKVKAYVVKGVEKVFAKKRVPSRLTCLACKANMYRIAGLVAAREGCHSVVTGESLGQVASQTAPNLSVLSRLVDIPIHRPLVFADKMEIAELARKLGLSALDRGVGGCSLRPPNPATRAGERDLAILREFLRDTEDVAKELVEAAERLEL